MQMIVSHFFILYCDTKLILYRKALNNASQTAMRYRLLATLFASDVNSVISESCACYCADHSLYIFKWK